MHLAGRGFMGSLQQACYRARPFETGWSGSGLGIDSQGNVWVTNRLGNSLRGALIVGDMVVTLKTGGNADEVLTRAMFRGDTRGGSVSLLHPDGSQYPGSAFIGGGLTGPWAATIDGNDNVWISNFAAANSPIVELCGVRTETCPPGLKTGDQMQTDLAISLSGDVWVMNNWEDINSCFGVPPEPLWRPGCHNLLRHGQAGARAADRPGAEILASASGNSIGECEMLEGTGAGRHLASFQQFPPRQRLGSFSVEQAMEKLRLPPSIN